MAAARLRWSWCRLGGHQQLCPEGFFPQQQQEQEEERCALECRGRWQWATSCRL